MSDLMRLNVGSHFCFKRTYSGEITLTIRRYHVATVSTTPLAVARVPMFVCPAKSNETGCTRLQLEL